MSSILPNQLFMIINNIFNFLVVNCGCTPLIFLFIYSVMQVQNEEDSRSKWERESESSDDDMLTDEALGKC